MKKVVLISNNKKEAKAIHSFTQLTNTPKLHLTQNIYTPRNEVVGGYTCFTMSVRPSVDKSYVVR